MSPLGRAPGTSCEQFFYRLIEQRLTGYHPGYLIQQFTIGEGLHHVGDGAIVDECQLVNSAVGNVQIKGIVATVDQAALEPPIEGLS